MCSNYVVVNTISNWWELPPKKFPTKIYEVGIVLTGVTDGTKAPQDRVYFEKGAERITVPLGLYKKGLLKKILITGGVSTFHEKPKPSAIILKDFLLRQGVPASDIIVEDRAINTRQNALFTKNLIDSLHLQESEMILFTSAFHMRRSEACFSKVALDIDTFPVSYYGTSGQITLAKILIPNAQQLHHCTKMVREIFGFVVYKILGYA